jgi:hypothetical protein
MRARELGDRVIIVAGAFAAHLTVGHYEKRVALL